MQAKFRAPGTASGTGAGTVLAGLALLLASPAGAWATPLKPVSIAQFRADVVGMQQLVAECETSAPACDPAKVSADEQVGSLNPAAKEQQGFAMHWQWLRQALAQARDAKGGRGADLAAAAAQLNEIAEESSAGFAARQPQSFAEARAAANAVLARPEFQEVSAPTWWDLQKAKLLQFLAQIFQGVSRLGSAAPWIGKLLEWLLFAGAAIGLLFVLLRNMARQRLRLALGAGAARPPAWEREATDWARTAQSHAAAGEWRDAVHCLYWAAIVLLESRRAWRHNPSRTPREYVRLLRTSSAQQEALRRLTQIFERAWYRGREAGAEEYARAHDLYEELAAAPESSTGPQLGPDADPAAGAP